MSSRDRHLRGGSEDVAPLVVEQVAAAYYPAAVQEASAARARAQNGYVVAAAIASAIVAAGVFGNVTSEPDLVLVCGLGSLVIWLTAALFFLWAVAGATAPIASSSAGDAGAFVKAVLGSVRTDRRAIDGRLLKALVATLTAIVLTVLTVVLAVVVDDDNVVEGSLVLTTSGRDAIQEACLDSASVVDGRIDPETLGDPKVKFRLTSDCRSDHGPTTIWLKKDAIIGFVED